MPDGGLVGVAHFYASRYGTGEAIVMKLDADGDVAGCADVHPSDSVATPGGAQTSKAALTSRAADLVAASGSLIVHERPNATALRCFVAESGPADIPTLSQWTMGLLAGLLGCWGAAMNSRIRTGGIGRPNARTMANSS
jgi:hypothetical protein